MKDYNIEYSIEKINLEKTKEYFREVSSSYFNGNYRASIVTLYSVVITDIIGKLEVLNEIYSDATAKAILDEIKDFQLSNPISPDWEKDIIEKVKARTGLIDNVDYAHIQSLKNDRHLCAHPVIDKEDKLYTPSKENVASHIRNMLESLFLKPALLSKKILSTILVDIANKKEILIDTESLEKYVISKYLNNLNSTVEITIFRDLWKFVFSLNDTPCSENRWINYKLLFLLYKRNTSACIQKVKNDKEYFSNILNEEASLNFLIAFLSENEFLFNDFREDIHLLIKKHVEKDMSAKIVAWFLHGSFLNHLDIIKPLIVANNNKKNPYSISSGAYQRLITVGYTKGYNTETSDFIIWRYSNSRDFNDADKNFVYVLKPNLEKLSEEQLIDLCLQINANSQVWGRKQAEEDHLELKLYLSKRLDNKIDFNKYPNVFK